jgi:hypothetical protein
MSDLGWIVITIFIVTTMIMSRLDRLGRQLEAVCVMIRADLPVNDRDEIRSEWRESKKQAEKDARHFWILWGAVAAAMLVWHGWRSLS